MRRIIGIVVLSAVLCPAVFGEEQGKAGDVGNTDAAEQHEKIGQKDKDKEAAPAVTTPAPTAASSAQAEPAGTLPPGLAKKDKLPHGLEKQGKTPKGWKHGKKTGWGSHTQNPSPGAFSPGASGQSFNHGHSGFEHPGRGHH